MEHDVAAVNSDAHALEDFVTISVENFGPIRLGQVQLKPLTVLIGANNCGKTYVAQLIYLLSRVLSLRLVDAPVMTKLPAIAMQHLGLNNIEVRAESFDPEVTRIAVKELEDLRSSVSESLENALESYFGVTDIVQISRVAEDPTEFRVSVSGGDGHSLVEFGLQDDQFFTSFSDEPRAPLLLPRVLDDRIAERNAQIRFGVETRWLARGQRYGIPNIGEYYLPSARSGILTAWPLLTSMAFSLVRSRLGPRNIEVGALQGVAGDFLQVMLDNFLLGFQYDSRRTDNLEPQFKSVLDLLEGELLLGRVVVQNRMFDQAELRYNPADLDIQLPVERSSSMVAEVAPLDLWTRELLREGDLLVVDEPEAHLHPQNQRLMARVLVRLVNAGVRVVCPTHSSLIVQQLSNALLASTVSEGELDSLGFSDMDLLDRSQIGVYLFKRGTDGVIEIEEVEILEGFGISEEEFLSVAEEIGEESFRLTIASDANGK